MGKSPIYGDVRRESMVIPALPDAWRALRAVDVPDEAIPEAIGLLARLHGELLARLVRPDTNGRRSEAEEDSSLLTATEVAERLGCSTRFVYDHKQELGAVELSPRCLRFRPAAVERHIARQQRAARAR
jgi:predicted DNA-binding transcriptional regulator AlpA